MDLLDKGTQKLFSEAIAEHFANVGTVVGIQPQEAIRTPNRYDQKITLPHHITVKPPTVQGRKSTLKTTRGKCRVIYKGKSTRKIADFSTEIPKNRRAWNDKLQSPKRMTANLDYSIQQSHPSKLKEIHKSSKISIK